METLTGKAFADALQKPFDPKDVEWKIQTCGLKQDGNAWAKVVPYLDADVIRARLDKIVGPENWKPEKFEPGAAGGVQSGLSIRINNEWVTKWDGADNTNFEAVKGGMSDAFKRVARVWGIGRYLVKVEPQWAIICDKKDGGEYATGKDKKTNKKFSFYWKAPGLPAFCWPENYKPPKHDVPKKRESENQQLPSGTSESRSCNLELEKKKREVKAAIGQLKGQKLRTNESAFSYFMRQYHKVIEDYEGLENLNSEIYYFLKQGELREAA